ncbi:MAG TPA: Ku protein [Patescibacteria group bacterium]|nr:Ku protein [Patescibacteria group bacterium]
MRAIWSGSINFGLVNIPIQLYPATQDKNIDFDYLHEKDLSPVRYAKVCKKEEREIKSEDIVRGFEIEPEHYVVVTDDDIKRASPEKTDSIQILSFAKEDEIDSEYFETPYYIEPDKKAQKAYYLLYESLKESKTVGVASFILRTRETLGVIKVHKNLLVLNRIRYSEEIRDYKELDIPRSENITKAELEMATSLIKKLTKKFEPDEYQDTYREKLEKTIRARAGGKKLPEIKEKKQTAKVEDLMTLLRESLDEGKAATA